MDRLALFLTLCTFATAACADAAQEAVDRKIQQQIRVLGPAQPPGKPASGAVPNPPTDPATSPATTSPATTSPAANQPPAPPAVAPPPLEAVLTGAESVQPPSRPAEPSSPATMPSASLPNPRRSLAAPSLPPATTTSGERPRLLNVSWDNLPMDPTSTAAALAMVVGLMLLCIATLRKAGPKSQRMLPGEVAAVLGRVPLGGKQMAHLLKFGNKLLLVHIAADEVKTLAEVTDPAEVTQLLGMCEQTGKHSASSEFRDVFEKLAAEPTAPGFLGDTSNLIDRQKLADAYSSTPGGRHA